MSHFSLHLTCVNVTTYIGVLFHLHFDRKLIHVADSFVLYKAA